MLWGCPPRMVPTGGFASPINSSTKAGRWFAPYLIRRISLFNFPDSSPLHDRLLRSPLPESWVTNTLVNFSSSCSWRSQRRSSLRTCASSAPTVHQAAEFAVLTASARASTRCFLAAELCRITICQMSKLHHLQQFCHFRFDGCGIPGDRDAAAPSGQKRCCRALSYGGTARNAGTRNRPCDRARAGG